jgi:hypothetical protein
MTARPACRLSEPNKRAAASAVRVTARARAHPAPAPKGTPPVTVATVAPPPAIAELVDHRRGVYAALVVPWRTEAEPLHVHKTPRGGFSRGDVGLPRTAALESERLPVTHEHDGPLVGVILAAASDAAGLWSAVKLGRRGLEAAEQGWTGVSAETDTAGRLCGLALCREGSQALRGAGLIFDQAPGTTYGFSAAYAAPAAALEPRGPDRNPAARIDGSRAGESPYDLAADPTSEPEPADDGMSAAERDRYMGIWRSRDLNSWEIGGHHGLPAGHHWRPGYLPPGPVSKPTASVAEERARAYGFSLAAVEDEVQAARRAYAERQAALAAAARPTDPRRDPEWIAQHRENERRVIDQHEQARRAAEARAAAEAHAAAVRELQASWRARETPPPPEQPEGKPSWLSRLRRLAPRPISQ